MLRPLLLLLVMMTPVMAWAAPMDRDCEDYVPDDLRDNPRELLLRGVACFEKKDYARALRFYRRSFDLQRNPLAEAAIGRSMHELGLWSTARSYYKRYLRNPAADADGKAKIQQRLKQLGTSLRTKGATLKMTASPTRTRVWLELPNGHRESLGSSPMTFRMSPGPVTILFEKKGYYPSRHTISLTAREFRQIDAELVPQDTPFNISNRALKRYGFVTAGVSLPVFVVGAVVASVGFNEIEKSNTLMGSGTLTPEQALTYQDALERGYLTRNIGTGVAVVGAAALVTGVTMVIMGYARDGELPEDEKPVRKPPKPRADLLITPSFLGVQGSF